MYSTSCVFGELITILAFQKNRCDSPLRQGLWKLGICFGFINH